MAFDVTSQADLTALKNLVDNTPALSAIDNVDKLVATLNDPEQNPSGATGAARLTPDNLLSSLWGVSISSQDQFKIQLLFEGTGTLDDDISRHKAPLSALSNNIATAIASIVRPLSYVEELFSDTDVNGVVEYITITVSDWIAARDNG